MQGKTINKVILNGRVYTVNDGQKWAEAIAISEDTIEAVGSNDEIKGLITGGTKVIDAKGRLVLPGFIDNHCHPSAYTYKANTADVFSCTTVEEYQKAIVAYAKANPELEVIKGAGWFYSDFQTGAPHKKDLDMVIDDKPVMIYSGDFHSLWVNSKALAIAEITEKTPNPAGGEFAKDENGALTGYINEIPAVKIIEAKISSFTADEFKKGIICFFEAASEAGITAVHDAGILDEDGILGYQAMAEEDYSVRVFASMIIKSDYKGTAEEELNKISRYKELENNFYRCNTVKMFMDGVPEANTAVVEEPYLNEEGNKGEPQWEKNRFKEMCLLADKEKYQIHVHAIGDRAVRLTLDGFEAAKNINGVRDHRHMVAHVQLIKEDQIDRIKNLGVTIVPTAFWFEKGDLYHQVEIFNLGKERADQEYKMKAFMERGILVACGSDAPVGIGAPVTKVPFAPVLAIQQGITRCNALKDCKDPENVLNPGESVTLEDMIRTYTIHAARANFAENEIGSIAQGKKADIIILDQNIFEIPVTDIYKTEVVYTILNGKVVRGE